MNTLLSRHKIRNNVSDFVMVGSDKKQQDQNSPRLSASCAAKVFSVAGKGSVFQVALSLFTVPKPGSD